MRTAAYATIAVAAVVAAGAVLVLTPSVPREWPGIPPGGPGPIGTQNQATPTPVATPGSIDRTYRDVGFVGLPPPGAIPSDPEQTELVEHFLQFRKPGGPPYQGAVFLYADGRLIWNEYYDGVPPSASTGWLEQRLTVEGIELARGLATVDEDVRRLDTAALPDLLPASAWADITVRPYVPSGFAACLWRGRGNGLGDTNISLAEKLSELPESVQAFLGGRSQAPSPLAAELYGDPTHCLVMTPDEAHQLDALLRDAGVRASQGGFGRGYEIDWPSPWYQTLPLNVFFEPIFPDGTVYSSIWG